MSKIERIPNEPIIFYLSASDVVKGTYKLPSGSTIIITQSVPYSTTDDEEIEFLSKERFLGARRISDKEFRFFATKQFKDLPTVYNKNINSAKDVEEFVWTSESEQRIIAKLRENGYIVYKRDKEKKD